jgi:hypothetical protein
MKRRKKNEASCQQEKSEYILQTRCNKTRCYLSAGLEERKAKGERRKKAAEVRKFLSPAASFQVGPLK